MKPNRTQLNRRWSFEILIGLLFLVPLTGCSDPVFWFSGMDLPFSFHEEEAGKAYRSAQPTDVELENAINLLGLRTVINLRGTHPEETWYADETAVCEQTGVQLADFRMSAGHLPEPDMLEGIVDTLKTAEYPILIHCQSGADRTSAVAAVYRRLIAGDDKEAARAQLSYRFLHLEPRYPCMDYLIDIYEPTDEWLATYAQEYDQLPCAGG